MAPCIVCHIRPIWFTKSELCRECYNNGYNEHNPPPYTPKPSTNEQYLAKEPEREIPIKKIEKPRKFLTSENLDSEQQYAVRYQYDEPLIVRAGPGAGKTRVVVERIKDIICQQDVDPSKILCLSFSKNAQLEMLERFDKDVDLKKKNIRITKNEVMTIHSLAMKISGGKKVIQNKPPRNKFDKWYESNLKNYKEWMEFQRSITDASYPIISLEYPENDKGDDDFKKKLTDGVSTWKTERKTLLDLEKYISDLDIEMGKYLDRNGFPKEPKKVDFYKKRIDSYNELYKYFEQYQKFLEKTRVIDFADMIERGIQIFETNEKILAEWQKKYEHVVIDEFQDNNYLQTLFAKKLTPKGHITIVGDEDQCVFTFQGANPKNFENFKIHYEKYHPEDIILKTNYRSTKNIVEKSQLLLDVQKNRQKKELITNNELGSNVRVCEFLTEKNQFEWIRNEISERLFMKTRSLVQKNNIAVLFRTNKQKKRFEQSLTDELKGIEILTVHKSKGKEYSTVFIPNVMDGNFPMGFQIGSFPVPDSLKNNYENKESEFSSQAKEERRILYVGMTRAKKELILSFHKEKFASKSHFIDDMGLAVENVDSKDDRPKKKEKWFESKKDVYKTKNWNKPEGTTPSAFDERDAELEASLDDQKDDDDDDYDDDFGNMSEFSDPPQGYDGDEE